MKDSRLGLFGGTFDPLHLGHLIMAERAAEELSLDKILFVPAQTPPHKPGRVISSADHRIEMIRLAISGNERFAFSDLDMRSAEPSYTSDLVSRVSNNNPHTELFFIAGGDSLRDFPTWHEPDTIIRYTQLAIARRPGVDITEAMLNTVPELHSRIQMFDSPLIEISSTTIRDRVYQGLSIKYLVPDTVHAHIVEHSLYLGTS